MTQAVIDEGRQALTAAIGRHHPGSHGPGALSAALFGLQTTLFHLGVLDAAPRKTSPDRSAERAAQWQSAAPLLASTLTGYIAQVRLSLRAPAMVRVEGVLRLPSRAATRPPPGNCRPVPGAQVNGLDWTRPVTVNEIQSVNSGAG